MLKHIEKNYKRIRLYILVGIILFYSNACCTYKDVKFEKQGNSLRVTPEMYNVSFARFKNKWGIVWKVVQKKDIYLDSPMFCKRQIYFGVVDLNLKSLLPKPILLHEEECNMGMHDIFTTESGFGILYSTQEGGGNLLLKRTLFLAGLQII